EKGGGGGGGGGCGRGQPARTRRLPCGGASFPAIGMTTSPGALQASSRVPACDGVRCCAVWKNWDIRNGAPNSPANRQKLTPFAAANLGWRNIASDSIGFGDRRSHSRNPAVKAAPPASAPITSPLAQPPASARVRPQRIPNSPALASASPARSRRGFPPKLSRTFRAVTGISARPTGTLIQKIQCQPRSVDCLPGPDHQTLAW